MRILILTLLLFLLAPPALADLLSQAQQELMLRRWERVETLIAKAPAPLSKLLEIDYRLARQEPDLVWADLQSRLTLADPEMRAYLQLLQALSLRDRGDPEGARRLLRGLEPVHPVLRLRAQELRILTALPEDDAQGWLLDLPETEWTELVRQRVLTARDNRAGEWAQAVFQQRALSRIAQRAQAPQLEVWSLLTEASLLLSARPEAALALMEQALERLGDSESEPERAMLRGLLASPNLRQDSAAGRLRGRLLALSPPGRTRWRLAGGSETLPGSVDRGALLAQALAEAEAAGDHQMAAWLNVCHVDSVFSPTRDRVTQLNRAIAHLKELPAIYPGKNEPFNLTIAALRDRLEEPSAAIFDGDRQRESVLRLAFDRKRRAELPGAVEAYLDHVARLALSPQAPSGLMTQVVSLLNMGNSNNREWEPDSLSFGPLREANPMSEMVVARLKARPDLLSALLSEPTSSASGELRKAEFLVLLGRHREARPRLLQLESGSDVSAVAGSRTLLLRSLARTGELDQGDEVLGRLLGSLMSSELSGGYGVQERVHVTVEALVLRERYGDAARLLDRYLEQNRENREQLIQAASSNFLIDRAMLARLLGEPLQSSLDLLEKGAELCRSGKVHGERVHDRYRAALLLEEGRMEEARRAYDEENDLSAPGSRLQVPVRFDTGTKAARTASWRELLAVWPQEERSSRSLSRVEAEVVAQAQPPEVVSAWRDGMRPVPEPVAGARSLSGSELLAYLGALARTEAGASLLLPLEAAALERTRASLDEGEILFHPLLGPDRLINLRLTRDEAWVEELFLDTGWLREEMRRLTEDCSSPESDPEYLERRAASLRELLWPGGERVWLLLPRPLDGVPWPLLAPAGTRLRWTDGALGPALDASVAKAPLLAGGHPDLPGSTVEVGRIRRLWPGARVWAPSSGFEGLEREARAATLVHLSGHGQGVEGRHGGVIDLGPLQVGVDQLFSLQLQRAPLVTLAACDGGLDHSLPDGRSFSLITPLRAAGAGGVLASLWTLDDERSAELFPAFYERVARGEAPGMALNSLRETLRGSAPPYVWAGLKLVESLPAPGSTRSARDRKLAK